MMYFLLTSTGLLIVLREVASSGIRFRNDQPVRTDNIHGASDFVSFNK